MKNFKISALISLILIITFIAFKPSLKNDFTNWDDDGYVTDNPTIQAFSPVNLKKIVSSFYLAHYQPITILSYLLEYQFFKLDPWGYHLDNLILHLLNCLLVYWVIYLLTGRISIAALTALFFGIHPLQVESVAWISERKNVLYAFFYLGAIVSYLYYLRQKQAPKYYFLCLGLFLLSLLSKSMAVTLPLVLLLLDYFKSRKFNLALFTEKIPHFTLSLVFGLVTFLEGYLSNTAEAVNAYGLFTQLKGAAYDIVFYLSKLFLPIKLSALYPYTEIKNSPLHLYALISVIILLSVVIVSRRYSKKIILGSGLFLIMIFPMIRFLLADEALTADRYVYLPCIGIFYLLAEGFYWLYHHRMRYYRLVRFILIVALLMAIVFLGHSTWKRCQVWKDSLSLWNDVLKKHPNSSVAYLNRGEFFLSRKEYAKARPDFMTALSLDPNSYEVYFNLAVMSEIMGNYTEGIVLANKSLQINPTFLKTQNLLMVLYGKLGKHSAVIDIGKNLIKIKPDSVEAYFNLCSAYGNLGNYQDAIACGKKAVALGPDSPMAQINLSAAYYYARQYDLAIQHCNQAIKLGHKVSPEFLEAMKNVKQDKRE